MKQHLDASPGAAFRGEGKLCPLLLLVLVLVCMAGGSGMAAATGETELGGDFYPGMLEGLAAMEAVDIASIERLELIRDKDQWWVLTSLTFQNRNPFPILIKQGRLAATFRPVDGTSVALGTLNLNQLLLQGLSLQGVGSTQIDARVRFRGDIAELRALQNLTDASERAILPMSVEGNLDVEVTVLSGTKIQKNVEVMLDFAPTVSRQVMARFDASLNKGRADTRRER